MRTGRSSERRRGPSPRRRRLGRHGEADLDGELRPASGGTSHGRANALSRDRLPGENRPASPVRTSRPSAPAEPDQGLEGVLVQSGQMEGEGMDAAGGGAPPGRRPTRARGAVSRTARGEWSASGVTFTRRRVRPAARPE